MPSNSSERQFTDEQLQDLVASTDSGARNPAGLTGKLITAIALFWSVFQIAIASPWATMLPSSVLNNTRNIHLAIAIFLAFMAYPAFKRSSRTQVPWADWLLAAAGVFAALYGMIFYEQLVSRPGNPNTLDIVASVIGIVIMLEAARRALGPALAIVAIVFLIYVFFGAATWVPDVIRWKGASLNRAMSHMWLTTEGVFGIALGVSTKFVFLFVLFGALLDKAGAGGYFIRLAFGALGHLKGGPAKAAVVGSAATGLISGSSIANVVTTGTFTIPLMKKVGFTPEQAGSVEVASSVNGQIMPPVMGAAAFLMVEYVGISYLEVIKAALIPAVISYIALVYIVHLEAVKKDMPTLPRADGTQGNVLMTIIGMLGLFIGFSLTVWLVSFPVGFLVANAPAAAPWVLGAGVLLAYVALLSLAARTDQSNDDELDFTVLPRVADVWRTGIYFVLPIVVLVYFLMIERKSPGLSAFWATALMIAILLTQRPLLVMMRKSGDMGAAVKRGFDDLIDGLITGARNMIGIGVATATAGLIVGTVSLTGIGQVMADFVEFVSGGNLIMMLVFVGFLSLVLGMGLPTTANYIVVSSLMAGVIVELGAQSGLIVPLIAVHLFVFYFGIMADVTPPVGLASFAAAAVSGGDPIKTGFTAFFYSLRTVALPFLFIFNTDLLLIDVTPLQAVLVFIVATIAMLVFAAATQGYFFAKSRWYEALVLLFAAFVLFRPGFLMDRMVAPFSVDSLANVAASYTPETPPAELRFEIAGPDFDSGEIKSVIYPVTPAAGETLDALMGAQGLMPIDGAVIEEPFPTHPAFESLKDFDFYGDEPVQISSVKVANPQPAKEWLFIPAILLIVAVAMLQRRRTREVAHV